MKHLTLIFTLFFSTQVLSSEPIVVWGEIFPPFGYEHQGKKSGLITEIVQSLIKDSGISVKSWNMAPWAKAFEEAKKNPNTLLYTVVRKPDREDMFYWIGPVSNRNIYMYKLASRKDIIVHSWEDIKKYSVGSLRQGASTENLESHGIKPQKAVLIETNVKKLLRGRIDLVDMLDYSMSFIAKQQGLPYSAFEPVWLADDSKKYYIVFNKNTSQSVVSAFQASFKKMQSNGELEKIKHKYLQ